MPIEETHEGLVLRSLDYKDRQKIITLFTPNRGVISLIVKGITRKKNHLLTLTSPFTRAEYHFFIGRTDLYTFRDGTPLKTHQHLRSNLSHIASATDIAKALLASQLPGKPAPALYALTLAYLEHLSSFTDPTPLTTSYLLKLLKHDGLLCINHLPRTFTSEEKNLLVQLSEARMMTTLRQTSIPHLLLEKTHRFFSEQV